MWLKPFQLWDYIIIDHAITIVTQYLVTKRSHMKMFQLPCYTVQA